MGDDIELLEDFEQYGLKSDTSTLYFNSELTSDTFKNPEVAKHVKVALHDCIRQHQTITHLIKNFDNEMNVFILAKIGDLNLLLTIILFAVVCFVTNQPSLM